ncbi:MAG: DUF4012 domain-containing protein [Ilumatobacter sp.]|uniref:DUF4012 domain-containing protein n=1 Tax=Ilumatobacter sp. TaxID=1967498 RepID=UPI002607D16F|nr:DUF4012 domain-containing protein [Ilumatobacter sp.]MDJ0769204.1 DUF4012 domain-containing protein [Ilumatobacter sp.]
MKRQHVDETPAVVVATASGLFAALFGGLQPTGVTWWDPVLVAMIVGFATWVGASAAWWAVALTASVVAATSMQPIVLAVAVVVVAVALWIGTLQRPVGGVRAAVIGVALNLAAFSTLDVFDGASALAGAVAGSIAIASGLPRRRRRSRRIGAAVLGVAAGVSVVAAVGLLYSVTAAKPDLDEALTETRSAARAVRRGDFDEAASSFRRSSELLRRARSSIDRPWSGPARVVPGLSQNARAVSSVVDDSEELVQSLSDAMAAVDPSTVTLSDGRIDLVAVRRLADDLNVVEAELDELRLTLDDVESPWLVGAVQRRLDRAAADIDDNRGQLGDLSEIAELAPDMLGDAAPRRYLVMFTQPAEARGLGGFAGNFGELVLDGGEVRLDWFGRHDDLEAAVAADGASCADCPEAFLLPWGRFGFRTPDGNIGVRAWSNITMSPHLPSVAEVAEVLYPQSGRLPIDGVIVADPYVIAQLLEYTGPVRLGDGTRLARGNAADFLISGQYAIKDRDERVDVLAEAAETAMQGLLGTDLPDPVTLVEDFRVLVEEGRFLFWPLRLEEQGPFAGTALSGALDEPPGFGYIVNNAVGNKIDMHLERELVIGPGTRTTDGRATVRATITLTNAVPDGRQPNIVVGNTIGLRAGTNRMILTIYGPPEFELATLDGVPVQFDRGFEQGWVTSTLVVDLARREQRVLDLEFVGSPDGLPTWEQPLVRR